MVEPRLACHPLLAASHLGIAGEVLALLRAGADCDGRMGAHKPPQSPFKDTIRPGGQDNKGASEWGPGRRPPPSIIGTEPTIN